MGSIGKKLDQNTSFTRTQEYLDFDLHFVSTGKGEKVLEFGSEFASHALERVILQQG